MSLEIILADGSKYEAGQNRQTETMHPAQPVDLRDVRSIGGQAAGEMVESGDLAVPAAPAADSERQHETSVGDAGRAADDVGDAVSNKEGTGGMAENTGTARGPAVGPTVFVPSSGQRAALAAVAELVNNSRRSAGGLVITGYAGVGKTTMLKLIAREYGLPTVITPTGKAALRVQEASGLAATTVHRWLYHPITNPRTGKVEFKLKSAGDMRIPFSRLLLVDEASMIGASLWADIWRAAQMHQLKVVLVGDGFQLPPVEDKKGPSSNFSTMTPEFAAEHKFSRIELTEVMRQALDSPVIRASMALRESAAPAEGLAELPRVAVDDLLSVCLATRAAGGVVISYTNACRARVNKAMRGGPNAPALPQADEPLLVMRNNYELDLCNGEQATFDGWVCAPHDPVTVSDRYTNEVQDVRFGCARVNGKYCIIALEQLDNELRVGGLATVIAAEKWARERGFVVEGRPVPLLEANYGYCYTAHKAQGSEWPFALIVLERAIKLGSLEGRRWAYTAITRAKNMAAIYYGTP